MFTFSSEVLRQLLLQLVHSGQAAINLTRVEKRLVTTGLGQTYELMLIRNISQYFMKYTSLLSFQVLKEKSATTLMLGLDSGFYIDSDEEMR